MSAFTISTGLAVYAYRKGSVVLSGAIFGFLIAFTMFLANVIVGISLLLCYLATNKATRYRGDIKSQFEAEFKKGGQRNWVQIVSNLGVANLFVLIQILLCGVGEYSVDFHHHSDSLATNSQITYRRSYFLIGALSAISAALGDTLSSELGPVWSSEDPLLILNLRRVPKGTNGGITDVGLFASLIGGAIIGIGALTCQTLINFLYPEIVSPFMEHWNSPQWPILCFCLYSSICGSLVDSVLGALFQYSGYDRLKRKIVEIPPDPRDENIRLDKDGNSVIEHISGWNLLDNHDVNLSTILITSIFTPFFASFIWPSGTSI